MKNLTDEELKQLHNSHIDNALMVARELIGRGHKMWFHADNTSYPKQVTFLPMGMYNFTKPCGHSEPESSYRDPDTGAHRTAFCESGRLVIRGNGEDSVTNGTIQVGSRFCPVCFKGRHL